MCPGGSRAVRVIGQKRLQFQRNARCGHDFAVDNARVEGDSTTEIIPDRGGLGPASCVVNERYWQASVYSVGSSGRSMSFNKSSTCRSSITLQTSNHTPLLKLEAECDLDPHQDSFLAMICSVSR